MSPAGIENQRPRGSAVSYSLCLWCFLFLALSSCGQENKSHQIRCRQVWPLACHSLFRPYWKLFIGNKKKERERDVSENNVHWIPKMAASATPVRGKRQDLTFKISSTYSMIPQQIPPLPTRQRRVNEEKPTGPHFPLTVSDSLYQRVSLKLTRPFFSSNAKYLDPWVCFLLP